MPHSIDPAWPSGPARSRAARRAAWWVGVALSLAALPAVQARDGGRERDDHDRARAAVQAGQALPLTVLLARLQRSHPGQVMEVELDREDGRWIYEVKLLQAGQLLRLEVDAATGEVLRQRAAKGRPSR